MFLSQIILLLLALDPSHVPWNRVRWTECGGPIVTGTKVSIFRISIPPGMSPCVLADVQLSAWKIINAKCIKCHGSDITPGDVSRVGNLDLRTFESMFEGGNRGSAVLPGDAKNSLIYKFTSLNISVPPDSASIAKLDTCSKCLEMPLYNDKLVSSEQDILKNWINLGSPRLK